YEITFAGKNETSSIVYDKHVSSEEIIQSLLENLQYTVLLYDKSIIQAEYIIEKEKIKKARLVFMKMHNKIWEKSEIDESERIEHDWFTEEKGVPIMIRIDCDVKEHKEGEHAITHLTLSNHEPCRIPMKEMLTFSEFVRFVLFHFYDIKLNLKENRFDFCETITALEKKMIHFYWN
ncbi:MAG: DUF2290 domain-containing protein, partial [Lachnospiraceae bacterium]|nr:DUF2290 domain-containing protein [Lachnospiraceae bacterium]